VTKWADLAKEILGSKDGIQRSYTVRLNGKSGYIIMSNRKLLFLEEKGIISLKYSKVLEIPYYHIFKVNVTPNRMVIVDSDNKEYNFTKLGVDLEKIEKELQDLMATSGE
jgi:hypothetical protein